MVSIDDPSSHQHALRTLQEADMMLASMPQLAIDEVHTIEKVVPEWLAQALGHHVPNAVIDNIFIVSAHEGMTSRHKWRLEWNKAGQEAGLPTAIFIKVTPENPHLLQMLAVTHMGELEVSPILTLCRFPKGTASWGLLQEPLRVIFMPETGFQPLGQPCPFSALTPEQQFYHANNRIGTRV